MKNPRRAYADAARRRENIDGLLDKLRPYISEDDVVLPRNDFLRFVADRIMDDLGRETVSPTGPTGLRGDPA